MNCIVIYTINLYALLFIAIPYLSYFKYSNTPIQYSSFDCQSSIIIIFFFNLETTVIGILYVNSHFLNAHNISICFCKA